MTTQKKVMVVDDSRLSRTIITQIIKEAHPDWEVSQAENADQALELADESFDIYILDYNMNGMNGLELGRILRGRYANAYLTLLTANVQDSIRSSARESSIYFTAKPVTEDKIMALLQEAKTDHV